MATWVVNVSFGAEISGAPLDCLRSKLRLAKQPVEWTFNRDSPARQAEVQVDADSEADAGDAAIEAVNKAAAACEISVRPIVRSIRKG